MGEIINLEKAVRSILWANPDNAYEIIDHKIILLSIGKAMVEVELERIYPNPKPEPETRLFYGSVDEKGDVKIDLDIFTTKKPIKNMSV